MRSPLLTHLTPLVFLSLSLGVHPLGAAPAEPAAPRVPGSEPLAVPGSKTRPRPEARPSGSPSEAAGEARAASKGPRISDCAAHYQARRYAPARDCFASLLESGDSSPTLRYALGYCHFQLRELLTAARRFREAMALAPRDGDTRFMLGMTLARLGRETEARDALRQALRLGLQSEDPAEARRALALIDRILASRPRGGWLFRLGVRAGYDSRPRLEGAAAQAGTSDGEADAGSAVLELEVGLGHRWIHGRWGSTTLGYAVKQRLVVSDLTNQGGGRAGRLGTSPPELSLQIHRIQLELRATRGRLSGGFRLGGELELAGLRGFGPLVVALPTEADLRIHEHRYTYTRLALGAVWQRALDPAVEYLGGGAFSVGIGQHLRWKRLEAHLGYELTSWWLGTATQPASDCPTTEPCPLETPYTHLANRLQLGLEVRCLRWLRLRGEAGLAHRSYRPAANYRIAGGQEVALTRKDLTQQYRAALRFRASQTVWVELAYRYVLSHSSVNEEAVGIEEGYDRHVAEIGLLLERW